MWCRPVGRHGSGGGRQSRRPIGRRQRGGGVACGRTLGRPSVGTLGRPGVLPSCGTAGAARPAWCRPGMVPPRYGAAYWRHGSWRRGSWRHGVAGRMRAGLDMVPAIGGAVSGRRGSLAARFPSDAVPWGLCGAGRGDMSKNSLLAWMTRAGAGGVIGGGLWKTVSGERGLGVRRWGNGVGVRGTGPEERYLGVRRRGAGNGAGGTVSGGAASGCGERGRRNGIWGCGVGVRGTGPGRTGSGGAALGERRRGAGNGAWKNGVWGCGVGGTASGCGERGLEERGLGVRRWGNGVGVRGTGKESRSRGRVSQ